LPIIVSDVKGIPAHLRERIGTATVVGARRVSGPHETFSAADPFTVG